MQNDRAPNDTADYRFNIDAKNKDQASFKDWMAAQGIRIAGGAAPAATAAEPALVASTAEVVVGLPGAAPSAGAPTAIAAAPVAKQAASSKTPAAAESVSSERKN